LLIDHLSVNVASKYVADLLNLCLKSLNTPNQPNATKKAVCLLLKTLATDLKSVAELIVP
jgi:hypothetical protein